MIKTVITTAFTIMSFTMMAQFTGNATYKTASQMKLELDGVDPAMQERIQEMMSKQMQKEYTLAFNSFSSLYKQNEELDANPQQGGMMIMAVTTGESAELYKNTKDKRYTSSRDMFGKLFLVKDSLESQDWTITKETKQIGNYTCYKAFYTREQQSFQSVKVNNETDAASDTITEQIEVVAWYTPDIPVSNGPDMFGGLPGLILEVQNGDFTIICTKVTINPKDGLKISEPTKGKVMTEEAFEKMMDEKTKEMEKMRGGGMKKGDGHSIEISIGG